MNSVRDSPKLKGTEVWCIEPEATQVVGLISEREYARKIVLLGRTSPTTLVRDIMTSPVMYIHLDQPIGECMTLMTEKRTRHLPAIDNGKLVGLISIGEIVKSIVTDHQFMIDQLARYGSG